MEKEQSLYQLIKNSVTEDGMLPPSFSLPEKEGEKVKFAAGAQDGILIYHMGISPLGEEDIAELDRLLMLAVEEKTEEAERGFAAFCEKHRAAKIIDDLQQRIMEQEEELPADRMFEFAESMMLHSADAECVKIGMSILELFRTFDNEELAEAIRTMGLSDEFTLFSVFLVRRWPDGEEEVLELAKKVRGWGRIHCVCFIEPESDEIKDWLFENGVDNDVVPAYSAYKVFNKAEVAARLDKEDLTKEEMGCILKIVDALLDEGPVRGISNLDEPEAFLAKVAEKAQSFTLDTEELRILEAVKEWKEED